MDLESYQIPLKCGTFHLLSGDKNTSINGFIKINRIIYIEDSVS